MPDFIQKPPHMLIHPHFNPVAVQIGKVAIHWYGLMYLIGFLLFLALGRMRIKQGRPAGWQLSELDDLLFYGVLGVILGGRLGYVCFYKPDFYLGHPLDIVKVWEGGMSFHGGFIGVLVAVWAFAHKTNRRFFEVSDFIAPLVPLGLLFGRLGNFINGELWGRVTDLSLPWAMGFPTAATADATAAMRNPQWARWLSDYGMLPRHPSQLYEMLLEGVVLFLVLFIYSSKPRKVGQVSALFMLGYGISRFCVEFTREPDDFLGLLKLGLSMGQWLSVPMIILGIHLLWMSSRKPR